MMQLVIDQVPDGGKGRLGIFQEGTRGMEEIFHKTRMLQPPFHRMPNGCAGLTHLLEQLLDKETGNRLTALQALNDPWFTASSVGDLPLSTARLPTSPLSEVVAQRHHAASAMTPSPAAALHQAPRYISPGAHASVRPTPVPVLRKAAYVMPGSPQVVYAQPSCARLYAR